MLSSSIWILPDKMLPSTFQLTFVTAGGNVEDPLGKMSSLSNNIGQLELKLEPLGMSSYWPIPGLMHSRALLSRKSASALRNLSFLTRIL